MAGEPAADAVPVAIGAAAFAAGVLPHHLLLLLC